MQKIMSAVFFAALVITVAAAKAPSQSERIFMGQISDSACGLDHAMPGETPAQCAARCVKMGAKYVLADSVHQKVYALSDQAQAAPFAGQPVKVIGKLRGAVIEVKSIAAVK